MFPKLISFLFLLIICLTTEAFGYSLEDIEWESAQTATLHWGNSITVDSYIITAADFSLDGFAYITISKDNAVVNSGALRLSDELVYRDSVDGNDIKVYVSTLNLKVNEWTGKLEDPTVTLQIYRRGLPNLKVKIDVEQDTYDPAKLSTPLYIKAKVTIENVGSGKASNLMLNIDTDGLELADGKLTQTTASLEKEESTKPLNFSLKIPLLWDSGKFDILAEVTAYDIHGKKYKFNATKSIDIKPKTEIILTKICTNEIYIDETAYVTVIARNTGSFSINSLTINDTLNDNFSPVDDVQLEKIISIGPDQTVEVIKYAIKPLKPGTYKLPAATADFIADGKSYSSKSKEPAIEVKGPYIVLEKKANISSFLPGDDVLITIEVKNEGNRAANVKINEIVPEGTSYVTGPMSFNSVVKAGSSESFSYTLKLENKADIELPATKATFIDMEGYTGMKNSSPLLIPFMIAGNVVVYHNQPEEEYSPEAEAGQQVDEFYNPETEEDMESFSYAEVSEDNQKSSPLDTNQTNTIIDPNLRQQPGFELWVMLLVLIVILKIEKKTKS
ncbi:MAG: DUF11 domain-containing protein [Methanomethylovorans sp.]|jgi:uncharacterized repeat protein (TIGR01451 family)|nr:DUF11 domain-containing protein [Methanomethylovorans sp.]